MTSLASLMGAMMTAIQVHPVCRRVSVVETKEFSPEQFYFKVRAELPKEVLFQVRVYYNKGHIDYAYQLFGEQPFLRWDNKEEFPDISSYPHHHHDPLGNILPSGLTGDPHKDVLIALDEAADFIDRLRE